MPSGSNLSHEPEDLIATLISREDRPVELQFAEAITAPAEPYENGSYPIETLTSVTIRGTVSTA